MPCLPALMHYEGSFWYGTPTNNQKLATQFEQYITCL